MTLRYRYVHVHVVFKNRMECSKCGFTFGGDLPCKNELPQLAKTHVANPNMLRTYCILAAAFTFCGR